MVFILISSILVYSFFSFFSFHVFFINTMPKTAILGYGPANHGMPRTVLTREDHHSIYYLVQSAIINNKIPHGHLAKIGKMFSVDGSSIKRIWLRGCASIGEDFLGTLNIANNRANCGRKPKHNPQHIKTVLKTLVRGQRRTIRDSAHNCGMTKTSFHNFVKKKIVRPHTSAVKPLLNNQHLVNRLAFVNNEIDATTNHYNDMYNRIHIDEKWFNAKETTSRIYLAEDEEDPVNTTRHKSHIPKCLHLCAVGRPRKGRLNDNGRNNNSWSWDGKIGCWPVVEIRAAQRTSVHRQRGTLEPHPISVTKAVYEDFICEKVLPAILERCPYGMRRERIYIQHDNAPPHLIDMERFHLTAAELGLDVEMYFQPAQSPDLNICDLSFFPSIQSLYYKIGCQGNLQSIIDGVKKAYDDYSPTVLNRCWLSLMMNYNKVIEHNGSNQYKLGHMGKEQLERQGRLPTTIMAVNHNLLDGGFLEVAAQVVAALPLVEINNNNINNIAAGAALNENPNAAILDVTEQQVLRNNAWQFNEENIEELYLDAMVFDENVDPTLK
jgi:hypothetical protein